MPPLHISCCAGDVLAVVRDGQITIRVASPIFPLAAFCRMARATAQHPDERAEVERAIAEICEYFDTSEHIGEVEPPASRATAGGSGDSKIDVADDRAGAESPISSAGASDPGGGGDG